jgi:nucleotide-binding universal stress UspA family protein
MRVFTDVFSGLHSQQKKGEDIMFRKILYPSDFSDVSNKALAFVKGLREAGAVEVVVLHVIDMRHFAGPDVASALDLEMLDLVIEKASKREMEAVSAELMNCGFIVKEIVRHGIPLKEILKVEEEEAVSVTVIGSHGKGNVAEMLLGSVSEKFIRKSKKPVIVVKR